MESSQDDAGLGTSDSRRISARENIVAECEQSSNNKEEISDIARSQDNSTMSEDNFDGDSVPSPSGHDVNASTEAILDMIDEFVDGPDAPKRCFSNTENVDQDQSTSTQCNDTPIQNLNSAEIVSVNETLQSNFTESRPHSSLSLVAKNEELCTNSPATEDISRSFQEPISDKSPEPVVSSQTSAAFIETCTPISLPSSSIVPTFECNTEAPSESTLPNIPSSSGTEGVEKSCDVINSQSERTVKQVSSSDKIETVKIESAESTCSDISTSVHSQCGEEVVTRSPLKRRLVRPAPSDRRPDTTVSSSADSPSSHTVELAKNDRVTKDVSSSSDAITSQKTDYNEDSQFNYVSEISVCKAQTSVSASKKIRLVRNKNYQYSNKESSRCESNSSQPVAEACESTSYDVLPETLQKSDSSSNAVVNCITKSDINQPLDNDSVADKVNDAPVEDSISDNNNPTVSDIKECQSLSNCVSLLESHLQNHPVENDIDHKKVAPLKINLSLSGSTASLAVVSSTDNTKIIQSQEIQSEINQDDGESHKQVPKLTIKLSSKQSEDSKPSIPKVTIKPLKPPVDIAPVESKVCEEQIPNVTKINIKPIVKVPQNIKKTQRQSSSSDISESESSENDESTSTSDQASASDHGRTNTVPKVTIKLAKPGTENEGNFYTEQSVSKSSKTKSPLAEEPVAKIRLKVNPNEDNQYEKIPKMTIKSINKSESPVSSPKLTIKPLKPPGDLNKESSEEKYEGQYTSKIVENCTDERDMHVPKITIKPLKLDEVQGKQRKSSSKTESDEQFPIVTKINIKPIPLPVETEEHKLPDVLERVPKINIKPVIKPKDTNSPVEEIPKITKLNIKPIMKPDDDNLEIKTSNNVLIESRDKPIPIVSKLNIKPIKPPEEEHLPDSNKSESQLSEEIPFVTKLNIKPIIKPIEVTEVPATTNIFNVTVKSTNAENVPSVTKLNIKPIVKLDDCHTQKSLTRDESTSKCTDSKMDFNDISDIPIVNKINIKPIVRPDDTEQFIKSKKEMSSPTSPKKQKREEETIEKCPPIVMKLNLKTLNESAMFEEQYLENDLCVNSLENSIEAASIEKIALTIPKLDSGIDSGNRQFSSNEFVPTSDDKGKFRLMSDQLSVQDSNSVSNSEVGELSCTDHTATEHLKNKNVNINQTLITPTKIVSPDTQNVIEQENKLFNEDEVFHNKTTKEDAVGLSDSSNSIVSSNEKLAEKSEPMIDEKLATYNIDTDKSLTLNIDTAAIESEPKSKIEKGSKIDSFSLEELSNNQAEVTSDQSDNATVVPSSIEFTDCQNKIEEENNLIKEANTLSSASEYTCKENLSMSSVEESIPECTSTETETDVSKGISNNNEQMEELLKTCETSNSSVSRFDETFIEQKNLIENENKSEQEELKSGVWHTRSRPSPKHNLHINEQHSVSSELKKLETNKEIEYKAKLKTSADKMDTIEEADILESSETKLCSEYIPRVNDDEKLCKPLEINVSVKTPTLECSGQDSPRIILKIHKTECTSSAKIVNKNVTISDKRIQAKEMQSTKKTRNIVNEKPCREKAVISKEVSVDTSSDPVGKRLRSSKLVKSVDKNNSNKSKPSKRTHSKETNTALHSKESGLSSLEEKRIKLGKLLSNKSLSSQKSAQLKQEVSKNVNNDLLINDNCSKNGNSKIHKILSNLQVKHDIKPVTYNEINCSLNKTATLFHDIDSTTTSTGSSDVVEIIPIENSLQVQEMLIHEGSNSRDFSLMPDDISQDPLDIDNTKIIDTNNLSNTSAISLTPKSPLCVTTPLTASLHSPQPRKRGRPRKLPVLEVAKPVENSKLPTPVPAERSLRSLRLTRDTPAILTKPKGRGRGRGVKRILSQNTQSIQERQPVVEIANQFFLNEMKKEEDIDPTSSRIKLPRLTEALDKLPSMCSTPLTRKRDLSPAKSDLQLFSSTSQLQVVLENAFSQAMENIPSKSSDSCDSSKGRGKRGRGSRGGRPPGRASRLRGRGRGCGGRGALYMKETMGIYGRVSASTSMQLFEEETCMMDDNATASKLTHLLDEDSQSSVLSLTNESSKPKKSKFSELFDSNKVWTASDVKEYIWPPPDCPDPNMGHQVMMIQEQVAMFLGVKSFKRRYPELKRRPITTEEKEFVLKKGIVSEALCDLGITAVDAGEVLDIMLSDFPHKYEEYRSYQRERQINTESNEPMPILGPVKCEVKAESPLKLEPKVDVKPPEEKGEPPPQMSEKAKRDMAIAAMASASEWNTRLNALRRPASVDLQTMCIQRKRPPPTSAPLHIRPPAGFYPHALLPGQYQHWCRVYTPEELRYFPLNTVLAAPQMSSKTSECSSESDGEWGTGLSSSEESSAEIERNSAAKKKKLMKIKRNIHQQLAACLDDSQDNIEPPRIDLCKLCGRKEEANRKFTYERFLTCSNCNAKLHPMCLELGPDTIRKCRDYPWQCAECKSCCSCQKPADDDKMLFCDLCDRGFHIYCVGLSKVPSGRWHCYECGICKSCGSRKSSGPSGGDSSSSSVPAEWHHYSKRSSSGHKVYSHSLCTPCARAYRIGRYCPLCDRSFIGPKGTMQLVICKLCDRQLHQDCVRQTVSNLNVLDYTCGDCRKGGITSRAAAARVAPRTIATLFMAKRRFNKYAHTQYMKRKLKSKMAEDPPSETSSDAIPLASEQGDISSDDTCQRTTDTEIGKEALHSKLKNEGSSVAVLEKVGNESIVFKSENKSDIDQTESNTNADSMEDEAASAVKALQMDFSD